ncbi:glycerophosphoryl diester phosphodiesterase membrane domain-containing protein [Sphingomonas sp. JC676]|uniref:glycerophosphoryl diester phosphodiesterase membrane domain-containing protein n=1 Tax=Sphingomonas sp. JC676 TaxID=2768065 RepID=UPI00223B220F|nr:glycerophosphoryl diester phosphodiesterase membrane domain-containing protein [Sphingomonas sp. JC676]
MSTVWDRTAEFLSDNIGAIVPIALIAFFVPASIGGNFATVFLTATPGVVLALRLVQLAFAILSVWGSLVIVAMALEGASGEPAAVIARRRLLPALAVSVVLGIAMIALTLPVPFFLAASGYDLTAIARGEVVDISPAVAGFVWIYFMVLSIAFIWIGARLIVTTPVVVREQRMLSAIPRSWQLTRGSTWRIIGVLILFVVVATVSALAANTVFGSIFALVAGGSEGGISLAGVLTSIVTGAVQTAFLVLLPAFTAKLYLALSAQADLRTHVQTP